MVCRGKRLTFALLIVVWCNGSTTGFGSVCRGSNPRTTTIKAARSLAAFIVVVHETDRLSKQMYFLGDRTQGLLTCDGVMDTFTKVF